MTFNLQTQKDLTLADYYQGLFIAMYEQAHDIDKVKKLTTDAEIAALKKELVANHELIKTKKAGKKLSPAEKDSFQKASLAIQNINFKITRLEDNRNVLYRGIESRARKIQGYKDMIEFVSNFDGKVPELDYIVEDGTRYKAVNNITAKDANGAKVLYMQNDKGNPTKKD